MSDPVNIAKIFIVIPAFNEQTSLRAVAKKLLALHYEVVVVDDGSENELKMILSDLPVYLLRHEVNL